MDTMKNCMPEAYKELLENCEILEQHYKDMMVNLALNRMLRFSTIYMLSNHKQSVAFFVWVSGISSKIGY